MNRLFGVLLITCTVVISCGGGETTVENGPELVAVEVAEATIGKMTVFREFAGTLEGIEQARLSSKLSETVARVVVAPGDRVRADDVLVVFDKSGSSSGYEQARAIYENAQKTMKKMKMTH